jgi:hypothetical protein
MNIGTSPAPSMCILTPALQQKLCAETISQVQYLVLMLKETSKIDALHLKITMSLLISLLDGNFKLQLRDTCWP